MNDQDQPRPIAARLPAEPGWHALFIVHDAEGQRVPFEGDPERVAVTAAPIAEWGLTVEEPRVSIGASFASLFGDFFGSPRLSGSGTWEPLAADGARLSHRKGFFGYAHPGEAVQEAIDRIERPERERLAKEKARKDREDAGLCGRQSLDGRWCVKRLKVSASGSGRLLPHDGGCEWEPKAKLAEDTAP